MLGSSKQDSWASKNGEFLWCNHVQRGNYLVSGYPFCGLKENPKDRFGVPPKRRGPTLGRPEARLGLSVVPFSHLFWGRVPPTKIDYSKKSGTLILTSLLEDVDNQVDASRRPQNRGAGTECAGGVRRAQPGLLQCSGFGSGDCPGGGGVGGGFTAFRGWAF